MTPRWAAATMAVMCFWSPANAQERLRLTLDQCVARALRDAPSLRAFDADRAQAVAQQKVSRANLFPRLRLESNIFVWDDEQPLDLNLPASLPIEIPPTIVRDQVTSSTTLTLAQPLTPLWTIIEARKAQSIGLDVLALQRQTAALQRRFDVARVFLTVQQADKVITIAEQSVTQRQAQVARATALVARGVVQKNDLLRAQLGLSDARRQVLESRRNAELARARLAMLLGLGRGVLVDPVGSPPPIDETFVLPPLTQAEARAAAHRPLLKALALRKAQAQAGVIIAKTKLLPTVNAVMVYQHNTGSELQQTDAFFAGLTLAWNAWDWGATWYGIDSAQARVSRVERALEEARAGLRLQVRAAHTRAQAALGVLAVAKEAIGVAEENYRLTRARYEGEDATTFDVLDAETLLTRARIQLETGVLSALLSHADLLFAMGGNTTQIGRVSK